MIDRFHRADLLARRRASGPESSGLLAKLVEKLRAFMYPKQLAYFRSRHRRRATKKTRRSGATSGGCRELVARALEIPRFRAVYITDTRVNAERRAWKNDTQSGLVDVVEHYGTRIQSVGVPRYDLGGVTVQVRGGDLSLVFSNGSLIELYGANDEGKIMDLRGLAKHVYWVDEAQDVRWLERMYKAVIVPGMNDHGGDCWLTGTPGVDLVGLFYEVTRDDGEQAKGWEVHHLTVTDNPFWGRVVWEGGEWFVEDNLFDAPGVDRATHAWTGDIIPDAHRWGPFGDEAEATEIAIKVRWERGAGESIRENAWDENDPDLLREWHARWIKDGARFVYALHTVVERDLIYAPMHLADDGFPDVRRACEDLPGWTSGRTYHLGLGADLGTTRAFAWSLWGWSLADPYLYEVATWKKTGLDYDEMAQVLRAVGDQVTIGLWVADAGGGGKPAVKGWSKRWVERYQLPIIEAEKPNKRTAIKQMNNDIRKLHLRMRDGSPLLGEWKVHRWLPLRAAESDTPGGAAEDPRTHRDCSDAALYIHRHSYHHRFRPEPSKVLPNTPEWVLKEERELESVAIDDYLR